VASEVDTAASSAFASANEEAIEAWDGPLFDRFVQFRHLLIAGLGVHGEEALRVCGPSAGERVLDLGCGFGDTTHSQASARCTCTSRSPPRCARGWRTGRGRRACSLRRRLGS
jgi:hypothetical protein